MSGPQPSFRARRESRFHQFDRRGSSPYVSLRLISCCSWECNPSPTWGIWSILNAFIRTWILTVLLLATAASSQEIDGSYPKDSPDGRFVLYTEDEEVYLARADGGRPRQVGTGTALGWDPAGQNRFAWWRFELREDSFGFEDRVPVVYFGQPGKDEITELILGYLDWDVLGWWAPGIAYVSVAGWGIVSFQTQWVTVTDPDTGQSWSTGACKTWTVVYSAATGRFAYRWEETEPSDPPPDDFSPDRGLFVDPLEGERWEIGDGLDAYWIEWAPDGHRLLFELDGVPFAAEGDSLQHIRPLDDLPTGAPAATWGQIKNLHR